MPDVEMKPSEDKSSEKNGDIEKPSPPPSPLTEIKNSVTLLEQAVSTLEP